MADYMAAQITIGGCIARKLVPRLCRALCYESLALEWSSQLFEPGSVDDLLAARHVIDGELVLRLCDDDAAYGEFPVLEAFLRKHRIPFNRHSEGHYTSSPRLVVFRPKSGCQEWLATMDGNPLVEATPLWEIQSQLESLIRNQRHGRVRRTQDRLLKIAEQLQEAVPERPSPLPAFEIGKSIALRKAV